MHKRRLHHLETRLRWLKPWYFLVLTVISVAICVPALRHNNQHMLELRAAVYAADKNDTDVRAPLAALQAYVTTHMNTSLSSGTTVYPPSQLKYTYDRLVQARGSAASDANSRVYSEAQAYCEAQNSHDFSGRNRVPCIEQYVQSHSTPATAPIPDALYKFAFVSPRWSPDLAGWSLLAAIISGLLFIAALLTKRWLHRSAN
jgi:hypothetical protein